ncbi:MAG TPA: tripartite tricarboxylate transporter substrate-binding protein [Candidatus Binatia bacterium]|nr:tripartite tricarboxylate transporter substrate-binding protein [Candidatus Binatia bacterium]
MIFELRRLLNYSLNAARVQGFKILLLFAFLSLKILNPLNFEEASAQTPFYQGKSIRIIVGYQPGDNHDQWARTYTRFLGKHIRGNPEFVVQNMPGAGAMIAANHVYNVTKPDGLTLGAIGGALIMAQITGRKEVQFDWPKFTWIGTPDVGGHLLYVRSDSPFKTVDDLRQATDPPKCSATGVGSTGYDLPRLLQDALGLNFSVVSGYPGGAEQDLAMERGEVNCRAITIEGFFGREPFLTWHKNGFVRILLQTEQKRHHRITDVPTVFELMERYKVPEPKRRLVTTYLGLWGFGSRPIVSTPGVPADRVKILRDAWTHMFNDGEFKDELKKRNWEAQPVAGAELESLAKEIVNQPPEVTAALKRILSK